MEYKPYSIEWSRKRYLSEAIQKYFEDGAPPNVIVEDIVDLLEQWSSSYKSKTNKLDSVLNSIKTL
jgi:hypothetical protein